VSLPELPPHWAYRPLKRVVDLRFSSVDKHSLPDEEPVRLCNYLDVYRNDRITASLDFMNATATTGERARFTLRPGDVLLTKDSEDPLDIAIPACVIDSLPGVLCGYHLALLRPHPSTMDGKFLHRTLTATGVRDQFFSKAVGVTRFALGLSEVGDSLVPVPPLGVQHAIATFLDRKTAAIDALITKKERLIELLEEKRQALITQAVTKGLDPTVPMKDSGIEWLREVPAHWVVVPLKHRATLISRGLSPDYSDTDSGTPVINQACIYWQGVRLDRAKWHRHCPSEGRGVIRPGDLLINSTGTGTLGRAAIFDRADRVYLADSHVTVVRPSGDADARFLRYVLQTGIYQGYLYSVLAPGATNQIELSREGLRAMPVPMPPIMEQRSVADALDQWAAQVNSLEGRIKDGLAILSQYRQALISSAVTGKIDIPAKEAA
jgi:type I restriction enzyme S subunit